LERRKTTRFYDTKKREAQPKYSRAWDKKEEKTDKEEEE
jgi:hypothetical protein